VRLFDEFGTDGHALALAARDTTVAAVIARIANSRITDSAKTK
jgi:hypothetical protein